MNNFTNTNNGNNKKLTKNTRGIQLYNTNEDYGSTISLDYWQNFANIKINPLLPKEKRSQSYLFDYQNTLGILLPVEKVVEIIDGLKYVAGELIDGNYNFRPVGVTTARNDNILNVLPLSRFTENEEDRGIVVQICTNINGDGIPENVMNYFFTKTSYIMDYDYKTGNYERSEPIETQFLIFCKYFEQVFNSLTMSIAHSITMEELYLNNTIKQSLYQHKEKLGISNSYYQNNNSNNNSSDFFSGNNNSNNNLDFSLPNFEPGSNVQNGGLISGERLNLDEF